MLRTDIPLTKQSDTITALRNELNTASTALYTLSNYYNDSLEIHKSLELVSFQNQAPPLLEALKTIENSATGNNNDVNIQAQIEKFNTDYGKYSNKYHLLFPDLLTVVIQKYRQSDSSKIQEIINYFLNYIKRTSEQYFLELPNISLIDINNDKSHYQLITKSAKEVTANLETRLGFLNKELDLKGKASNALKFLQTELPTQLTQACQKLAAQTNPSNIASNIQTLNPPPQATPTQSTITTNTTQQTSQITFDH